MPIDVYISVLNNRVVVQWFVMEYEIFRLKSIDSTFHCFIQGSKYLITLDHFLHTVIAWLLVVLYEAFDSAPG